MISPLQQFLFDQIGPERLSTAKLVVDNARSSSSPPQRRRRPRAPLPDYYNCSSSTQSRSTVSLHSLPSLTSDSSVSRWDSCIKHTDCLTPPQRRPRKLGEALSSREGVDEKPSLPKVRLSPVPLAAMNPFTAPPSCPGGFQTPTLPIRKASFSGLPKLPRWDDTVEAKDGGPKDRSPNSVCHRAGLEEILGHALKECADLGDEDYDDHLAEELSTLVLQ
jgi:hypothetical protein